MVARRLDQRQTRRGCVRRRSSQDLAKSLDVPYMDFEIESKDQSIGTMGVFPWAKSGLSVENTITGTMTWGLSIVQE